VQSINASNTLGEITLDIVKQINTLSYMQPIKQETTSARLQRLAKVAETMTQAQVDACAWAMGASGCGWTPHSINQQLEGDFEISATRS